MSAAGTAPIIAYRRRHLPEPLVPDPEGLRAEPPRSIGGDEVALAYGVGAPAGLVSGPSTLKIVRTPISLRGPIACFIAE